MILEFNLKEHKTHRLMRWIKIRKVFCFIRIILLRSYRCTWNDTKCRPWSYCCFRKKWPESTPFLRPTCRNIKIFTIYIYRLRRRNNFYLNGCEYSCTFRPRCLQGMQSVFSFMFWRTDLLFLRDCFLKETFCMRLEINTSSWWDLSCWYLRGSSE